MRRNTLPPRARADEARMRAPEPPKRKIFNCIVDDSALIAGVKKSTRDGIRKWVAQDAIRLFVPLHTLAQLNRLKNGSERVNVDAREAVKWLDEITTFETSGRVQLEGVDEVYDTWEEVERFMLPQTLLSMEESSDEEEDYHEDLESSFNALDVSDETSISSTRSLEDRPKTPQSLDSLSVSSTDEVDNTMRKQRVASLIMDSPDRTARNSSEFPRAEKSPKSAVPVYLQPLFNHILWRIHKEINPDAALASFILLTNDPTKQAISQKFGIRAKRLEQLRDAVAREDREYKNHLTVYKMEAGSKGKENSPLVLKAADRPKSSHSSKSSKADEPSDEEDTVLFNRAPRGPAQTTSNNERVMDPNEFSRANNNQQQFSPRGGRGGRGGPRGGRGGFAARGAYVPPAYRSGGYVPPAYRAPPVSRHDPNRPIDPDSYARPAPRASPMRGARRKLWEPN